VGVLFFVAVGVHSIAWGVAHCVIGSETQAGVGGMSVSMVVRKNVCLDSSLIEEMNRIVKAKGGRGKGYSFSSELTTALKEYVQRQAAQKEEVASTPLWQKLLDEKFAQLETWLRPGVWGGATYSTAGALLLLEVMCGKKLDPKEAKDHFDLIRGRAWKVVRRDGVPRAKGRADEEG
jgi:hypothetical protein